MPDYRTAPNRRPRGDNGDTWVDRLICGNLFGHAEYPSWLDGSYRRFRDIVTHPDYPCFFGSQAERRAELLYTYVSVDGRPPLHESLSTFIQLRSHSRFNRSNLAAFYHPTLSPRTHRELEEWFWGELQMLHDQDTSSGTRIAAGPDSAGWEFEYHGTQMFVVVGSPTYFRRRSRNLGPGVVLLFQPRNVFIDIETGKSISMVARAEIRERLKRWDDIGPHPDLQIFGDDANREWKQYCLPDDDQPKNGACPFRARPMSD